MTPIGMMSTRVAIPMCSIRSIWPPRWTALLHDVLEDHGDRYSLDALARAGFPEAVLRALRLLTHAEGVPYMDYVCALAQDPIARRVKLADLRHNTDVRRLNGTRPKKYDLYLQAIRYLQAQDTDPKTE